MVFFGGLIQGILQALQFRLAPHHARLDPLHAARVQAEGARALGLHQVSLHRFGLALDLQGRAGLHIEQAAHLAVRVVGDQHAVQRAGMFQARSQVHRVAHGGKFLGGAHRTQQHLPAADANAQRQARQVWRMRASFVRQHLIQGKIRHLGLHGQRRADGALGVVFAPALHPPQRHDGIADMFVDPAAVGADDAVQLLPQAVDQQGDIFRVEGFGKGGKTGDIGKQHGDQLALLCARVQRAAGVQRSARVQRGSAVRHSAARFERRQLLAQCAHRGVHNRIPQDTALGFESIDRFFELLDFAHLEASILFLRYLSKWIKST